MGNREKTMSDWVSWWERDDLGGERHNTKSDWISWWERGSWEKNTMQWVIKLLSEKEDLGRKRVLGEEKSKKWGT